MKNDINSYRGNTARLRDLKNGKFQIHVENGPAFEGPESEICEIAETFGLMPSEIEAAKWELLCNNHDYADFGIFGTFIKTGKDQKRAA